MTRHLLFAALLLAALAPPRPAAAQDPFLPWKDEAVFVLDPQLSDEFNGDSLDLNKWDPHGIRNPDTGCPKWNGPPSFGNPTYSTFFPTSTDPATKQKNVGSYSVSQGTLNLNIARRPLSFFTDREYYCNAATFKCNHDPTIDCFATNFFGAPIFKPGTTEYAFVIHDKCKKEPYCIPSPEFVTKKARVYENFEGVHLTSKASFKYGYVEARVLLADSPKVLALWMHDDTLVDGYCRYRKGNEAAGEFKRVNECPSAIRSRRWQEIDMLEAMNGNLFKRRYVPNIHCFSGYKGEFTSKEAVDSGAGNMGGGPIVVTNQIFNEATPSFSDVTNPARNDFHLNVGNVYNLTADWASQYNTVGMYWSPKEIRFYINGQEVKRLENWLIHQPMRMDISTAWNVEWAKQTPTDAEVPRTGRVDYLRTYKVYTRNGKEPSSGLPLERNMRNQFNNAYGNKLGGVYGRFPTNDDETVVPGIPTTPDELLATTARAGVNDTMWEVEPRVKSADYFKNLDVPEWVRVRQAAKNSLFYGLAGGRGNNRYGSQQKKMNANEEKRALSQESRHVAVENGQTVGCVDAQTIYDESNPQGEGAGHATAKGDGNIRDAPSCSS